LWPLTLATGVGFWDTLAASAGLWLTAFVFGFGFGFALLSLRVQSMGLTRSESKTIAANSTLQSLAIVAAAASRSSKL
jgi:fatty acid desaturase